MPSGSNCTVAYPQPSVLLILCVAQGGGDFAFCTHLYRTVASAVGLNARLRIVLSVQAGLDVSGGLERLSRCFAELSEFEELRSRMLYVYNRRTSSIHEEPPVPANRSLDGDIRFDLIIQGPLLLFTAVEEVQQALRFRVTDTCRLVTVREFGQGRFCSPTVLPRSSVPSHLHVDVSAGVDVGEVGIWDMPWPSLSAEDAFQWLHYHRSVAFPSAGLHFVVYSRTQPHAWQAARLLACCIAWSTGLHVAVFAPSVAYSQAMLQALSHHPAVVAIEPSAQAVGHTAHRHMVTIACGTATRTVELALYYLDTLALPPPIFQALLATACGAVVCGDASLNEAVCYGRARGEGGQAGPLWWYSADGHKIFTDRALHSTISQGLYAAGGEQRCTSLIPALWSFLSSKGQDNPEMDPGTASVSGGAAELWDSQLKNASLQSIQMEYSALSAYLLRQPLQRWLQDSVLTPLLQ